MKRLQFDQQVVLITGASTGIGRATALAFAREGAKVAANYRANRKDAESLVADIRAGLRTYPGSYLNGSY